MNALRQAAEAVSLRFRCRMASWPLPRCRGTVHSTKGICRFVLTAVVLTLAASSPALCGERTRTQTDGQDRNALFLGHPSLHEPGGRVDHLTFSPDGRMLAYRVATPGSPGEMVLFDIQAGREIRRILCPPKLSLGSFVFNPGGTILAVWGTSPQGVRFWDTRTGKELSLHEDSRLVNALMPPIFSPDGTLFAAHHSWPCPEVGRGGLHLWRSASGEIVHRLVPVKEKVGVLDTRFGISREVLEWDGLAGCCFSSDGKTLAVEHLRMAPEDSRGRMKMDRATVHLWDIAGAKDLGAVRSPAEWPRLGPFYSPPKGEYLYQLGVVPAVMVPRLSKALAFPLLRTPPPFRAGRTSDGSVLFFPTYREPRIVALRGPGIGTRGQPLGPVLFADADTGKELATLEEYEGVRIRDFALSPDGKTFAAAGQFTRRLGFTVGIWDLSRANAALTDTAPLTGDELEVLWEELGAEPPARGVRAMRILFHHPDQVVGFVKARVQPAIAGSRVRTLVAGLDHDEFQVREAAMRELEKLGYLARPELEKTLAGSPSAEVRRRAERLLRLIPTPAPAEVRGLRAVDVLEHIGTREAHQLLETLGKGNPAFPLTQAARAAWQRRTVHP